MLLRHSRGNGIQERPSKKSYIQRIHLRISIHYGFLYPPFEDIPVLENGAMAKYNSYDYSQSVLLPVSLEGQLMPGTLEFAIHTLVEKRMDTSIFDRRYSNDETGRARVLERDLGAVL